MQIRKEVLKTLREAELLRGFEPSDKALLSALPEGACVFLPGDDLYPSAFYLLEEKPLFIAALGDISLAERQSTVAIVGSRDADESCCRAARKLAATLAERGTVIVSGMAAGIDRAAHLGALDAEDAGRSGGKSGRTVAVLGTPLSVPYPDGNKDIYECIKKTGLILSEVPQVCGRRFGVEERAASLRARNRLVAALGLGSVVMAARPGSSTLIEAGHALEVEHPVLIWHEAARDEWAQELLGRGYKDSSGNALVHVVSSAVEVDEILSPWRRAWWL